MKKRAIFPASLHVELTSIFPRWICYVSSPYPHRYFKGFKTHAELWAWMNRYGYQWTTIERTPASVVASSLTVER